MSAIAFALKDIKRSYDGGVAPVLALRGITLDILEGEFLVLLGASGSGKSTLLNIMGGLDRASEGELLFRGTDLTNASERELTRYRRDHVGFVFQFYNLIPSLTALENVALVGEIAKRPMASEDALGLVQLQGRMNHFPAQLSGGEQQRVAIARAIVKQPDILLCDEPTGALDSATGVVVLKALQSANERLGTTTVIITHNAAIAGMADRVIHLSDGLVKLEHRNERRQRPEEISW